MYQNSPSGLWINTDYQNLKLTIAMKMINDLKTPSFLQKLQWIGDPVGYMENAAQQFPDIFSARIVGFGNNLDQPSCGFLTITEILIASITLI